MPYGLHHLCLQALTVTGTNTVTFTANIYFLESFSECVHSLSHTLQPPNKIGESAPSLVRLQDLLFFDDFRDFGGVVNCWLGDEHVGGPWRRQELPDTDLTLNASDMLDFGRRYDQIPIELMPTNARNLPTTQRTSRLRRRFN